MWMKIEQPAWQYSKAKGHEKVIWTDDKTKDQYRTVIGTDNVMYRYLRGVVMHELGHALGLNELPTRYNGYMMYNSKGMDSVPGYDNAYMLQVYREHTFTSH